MKRGRPLRRRALRRGPLLKEARLAYRHAVLDPIKERSGGFCEARIVGVCTGRHDHTHHRKLRSQGGEDTKENLIGACWACHRYLHNHPAWARSVGLIVSRELDPAHVGFEVGADPQSHVRIVAS